MAVTLELKGKKRESPFTFVEDESLLPSDARFDGRNLKRKSVGDDKTTGIGDIADNTVTKTMMTDDAVGTAELDYETKSIVISDANTSGTATVTSGAVPVGYYLTSFTTPVAAYVQLGVSGTTLTATVSTAPGAGNSVTIFVVLLKP